MQNAEGNKLDKKDVQILHQLDLDARQPATVIGKKTRLSRESVSYRIKRMEDEGIIQGYYAAINVYALGYYLYKVFIALKDTHASQKKEMITYLSSIPEVGLTSTTGGQYDMTVGVIGKSNQAFDKTVDKILERYGPHIRIKDISIITDLRQYSKKFLSPEPHEWVFKPTEDMKGIDKLDQAILDHLGGNARMTTIALTDAVNAERKTVSMRMRRLEEEGIILGYRVTLNRQCFSRSFFRVLIKLHSHDERKLRGIFTFLKHHPATIYALKSIGAWEVEIEIAAASSEQGYAFIDDLKEQHDIIREVIVLPVFQDVKYIFSLIP